MKVDVMKDQSWSKQVINVFYNNKLIILSLSAIEKRRPIVISHKLEEAEQKLLQLQTKEKLYHSDIRNYFNHGKIVLCI